MTRRDDGADRDFAAQARAAPHGLVREFYDFVRQRKRWWLVPIAVVLLLLGLLLLAGGSPAAPFIYTLF